MGRKEKMILIILTIAVIAAALAMAIKDKVDKPGGNIKISDCYSLSEFKFNGDFNAFYKDSYDWYKSIENESGVYLVNTAYYNDDILTSWKENEIYDSVPDKAFWYYTVSPSYLKQMNINISNDIIHNAVSGTRLYLVPDTLSQNEIEQISSYLKEDALKNAEKSTVETAFTDNQKIKIISYTPNGSYFTFPSEKEEAVTDDAPIIYVCTCANMTYFEYESLIATGVDSYIKFDNKDIMKSYSNKDELKQYHLKFKKLSSIYKTAAKADLVDKDIDKLFDEK